MHDLDLLAPQVDTELALGVFGREVRRRRVRHLIVVGVIVGIAAPLVVAGLVRASAGNGQRVVVATNTPRARGFAAQASAEPGCLRISVDDVTEAGCLRMPGGALWRVAGHDFVVAANSGAPFGGTTYFEAGPSGFVVVPLTDYRARAGRSDADSCYTSDVSDVVGDRFQGSPPPFVVTTCTPEYVFAALSYDNGEAHLQDGVLVLERQVERWSVIGTLDMTAPRDTRCAPFAGKPAAPGHTALHDLCMMVG